MAILIVDMGSQYSHVIWRTVRELGAEGELLPKTRSCYSCHEQNGAVDTTFVQFYPTLRDVAAGKGTLREVKE